MRAFVLGILAGLAVCCMVFGWLRSRGGDVVVEVEGVPVTSLELQEALRAHLWQRSESWAALNADARGQARQTVLEKLVDDRLIRVWRRREGTADREAETRRESALQRRQFTDAADHKRRFTGQHHTQNSLDQAIRDAQQDEAWLSAKIDGGPRDDARAWYDQHQESLRIPQAHHAAHIFLTRHDASKPDREVEIRRIHRQLATQAKTFASLAKEASEDDRTKSLGGDLGWFTRQRMPADFVSAVEKLRVGEVSEPVATALGWHIIRVYERRPSRLPTFAECQHEIAASLASKDRETALKTLIADLRRRSHSRTVYHQAVIDRVDPAT